MSEAHEQNKNFSKTIKVVLGCFIVFLALSFYGCAPSQRKLEKICDEARDYYASECLPDFNKSLQETTGFSDLTVDVTAFSSEYSVYYSDVSNEVKVYLNLCNPQSDEIDAYYTTKEDRNGQELQSRMGTLLTALVSGERVSYTTDDGMKVTIYAVGDSSCDVWTSSGRRYEYYRNDGYEWIKIDGNFVYFRSGKSSSDASDHSTGSTEKSTPSSNRSYSSHGSSGGTEKDFNSDPYNVNDYDDPDDFANDYEDEFDDYEDAYDYWDEEHD